LLSSQFQSLISLTSSLIIAFGFFCLFGRFEIMSALVDIWTREQSKLREKDAASIQHESAQSLQKKDHTSSGLAELDAKLMQVNKQRLLFSDASLSMLVQCFSP